LSQDLLWDNLKDSQGEIKRSSEVATQQPERAVRFLGPTLKECRRANGVLQFVVRSHDLKMTGLEWKFENRLLQVFSARDSSQRGAPPVSANRVAMTECVRAEGIRSKMKPLDLRVKWKELEQVPACDWYPSNFELVIRRL
jgi:hypothetical protein